MTPQPIILEIKTGFDWRLSASFEDIDKAQEALRANQSKHPSAEWRIVYPTESARTPQTQFTPGPWKLTKNTARIEVHTSPREAYAFSLRDEANARLIAAAPELLEALKLILQSPRLTMDETHRAYGDAEMAIAKAEGRQP